MKKGTEIIFILLVLAVLCACGGGGNVKDAAIVPVKSDIYTEKEIDDAAKTAIKYFRREFSGCTLKEIQYIGDDAKDRFTGWAEQYGADEAIILISTFDVDASGGDGSLNPNSTYTNWQWILVRDGKSGWRHVTHGYG